MHSSYREKVIEHLFVGELLKLSWLYYDCAIEIARPEVDNSGYDFIMEAKGFVRHMQLKASIIGGKTTNQKVHTKLAEKPHGCVVWIYFDQTTLHLGPFLYYEAKAQDLAERKTAKHTKPNMDGVKAERKNLRVIPKSKFTTLISVKDLYQKLFIAI